MQDSDYPTSPYNPSEKMRVMRDLEASKRQAFVEDDQERMRNLRETKLIN